MVTDEAGGIVTSYGQLEAGRVYTCELRVRQVVLPEPCHALSCAIEHLTMGMGTLGLLLVVS